MRYTTPLPPHGIKPPSSRHMDPTESRPELRALGSGHNDLRLLASGCRRPAGREDECESVLMSVCCEVQHVMVDSTRPRYNSEEETGGGSKEEEQRREVEGGGGRWREVVFQRWVVGKRPDSKKRN